MRKAYSGFAIIMMAVLVKGMADSWLVRFELEIGVGIRAVNQMGKSEGMCI